MDLKIDLEHDFIIPFSFDLEGISTFRRKLLEVEVSAWGSVFEAPIQDNWPGRNSDSRTWFGSLSDIFWPHFTPDEQVRLYGNFVQALLDSWAKVELLPHDDNNPVHQVCQIVGIGGRNAEIDPRLLACYQRLWSESPRPYSYLLQSVVECSRGQLNISEAEAEDMFNLYSDDELLLSTMLSFALGKDWPELATKICVNFHQEGSQLSEEQVYALFCLANKTLPAEMVDCLRRHYPDWVAQCELVATERNPDA